MAKPTQIKAVAAVLEEEHESALDAAKAALNVYDELRQEDVTYTVAVEMVGPVYLSYGAFATRNQAAKWIEKGFPFSETTKAVIMPVYHHKHYERNLKEADVLPAPKGDWAQVKRDREAGVFKHG